MYSSVVGVASTSDEKRRGSKIEISNIALILLIITRLFWFYFPLKHVMIQNREEIKDGRYKQEGKEGRIKKRKEEIRSKKEKQTV